MHPTDTNSDITVPASYVRALLRAVAERGYDVQAFLAADSVACSSVAGEVTSATDSLVTSAVTSTVNSCAGSSIDRAVNSTGATDGLSFTELQQAQSVSAALFGRLYQRAILLLKDETLGMASGGRVPNGTFRMMCLCAVHCVSLGSILQRVGEFLDICKGATLKPSVTITTIGNQRMAQLGFALVEQAADNRSLQDILQADGPLRVRTSLYVWHNLLVWFAGNPLPLSRVTFNFAAPENHESWQRVFNCPVVFGSSQSAIEFPAEFLQLANVQSEASLNLFLRTAPYRLIVPHHREHTTRDRVLALLGDDFSQPLPKASVIAEKLNLSVSTLRRHLSLEGTSFQALKDECRYTAALRYLGSTELSLNEVARLLGFDEVSAFFRAFKRWSGTTPAAYRRDAS